MKKYLLFLFGVFVLSFGVTYGIIFLNTRGEDTLSLDNGELYKIGSEEKSSITLEGLEEEITVKKYLSNLGYSLKYDINTFKPERIGDVDKFTFIHDESIYLTIEKTLKSEHATIGLEEYFKTDGTTYLKITVHSKDTPEHIEGINSRISHLIDGIIFE